jgi:DNA-binding response OmpR family regulator
MTDPLHVILVEDELLIALSFQDALEEAGFRVTPAATGEEALEIDAADPADALVTDLRMGSVGGREVLARLRARAADLPAVVVSGYTGDLIDGTFVGPTEVLSKPVTPGVVVERLRTLLTGAAET